MKDFFELTKQFIAIQSTADNKIALDKAVAFCEKLIPLKKGFLIKKLEKNGKRSFVATYKGTKTPKIMLHGHIDVIPASKELFNLSQKNNKFFGRGVYDMKVSLLLYLILLNELPQSILEEVGIMVVSDEEIGGHNGAKIFAKMGYKPEIFITGEPSEMKIFTEAKGILWIEISKRGKAAHSSVPWEGDNAITSLLDIIIDFQKKITIDQNKEWFTTYTISKIEGGTVINAVPEFSKVSIDIRYTAQDDPEEIIRFIKKQFKDCTVSIVMKEPGTINKNTDIHIKKLANIIKKHTKSESNLGKNEGGTDARFFSTKGITAVSFSPMGGSAHTNKEWIDVKSIKQYKEIIREFLLTIQI